MQRLSIVDHNQLSQELLAKFIQTRFWHGWNGSTAADIWESQEMMALINETLLGGGHQHQHHTVNPTDTTAFTDTSYANGTLSPGLSLPFLGEYFVAFHKAYFSVHGYLAIVISVFGIVSNVINIAVLSQKAMVTPTNAILTALALVDVLVMLTYVPFAVHQYLLRGTIPMTKWRSYSWMIFICFNINFTIVCHTISVWLTITLAVFRYIAISHPSRVQDYCSMKRAITAIVMAFLCTAIICTPSYLSVQVSQVSERDLQEWTREGIHQVDWTTDANTTAMYRIDESDLSKKNNNIPRIISFYGFSVFAKLVPCVVLTWLSIQLVRALVQAERRRFHLKNPNGLPPRRVAVPSSATSTSNGSNGQQRGSLAQPPTETTQFLAPPSLGKQSVVAVTTRPPARDRTTRMLLAILVFFLITEFPSGLMALFSTFSQDFFQYVYGSLGDLMDILALVNSSVNFILYCSMSRQFRKTFCHMFVPQAITRRWKRWKVRRHGGVAATSAPITMTERTITYYPVVAHGSSRNEDFDN